MLTTMLRHTGKAALRAALATVADLATARSQPPNRPQDVAPSVARLAAHVATFDPKLAHDVDRTTRRVVGLAAQLEPELDRFCLLEARLQRAISRVEAITDQSVTDELFADFAERLGIMRVRPALEQLTMAHPDLGRRSALLDFVPDQSPAA